MHLTTAIGHRPADDLPNEWDKIADDLKTKMSGVTVSEEDVLTYAMFPQVALNFFKTRPQGPTNVAPPPAQPAAASVPVAASAPLSVSDQYRVSVDGKAYIVRQKRDSEGHLNLTVDGRTFAVGVKPMIESEGSVASPSTIYPVGEKLDAPMPGTVVKVLFQDGDTVEANATVLIMEALKMQLEIKCRTAGRIRFLVSANTAVQAGVPLAVISGQGKGEK